MIFTLRLLLIIAGICLIPATYFFVASYVPLAVFGGCLFNAFSGMACLVRTFVLFLGAYGLLMTWLAITKLNASVSDLSVIVIPMTIRFGLLSLAASVLLMFVPEYVLLKVLPDWKRALVVFLPLISITLYVICAAIRSNSSFNLDALSERRST